MYFALGIRSFLCLCGTTFHCRFVQHVDVVKPSDVHGPGRDFRQKKARLGPGPEILSKKSRARNFSSRPARIRPGLTKREEKADEK
jgi:hypothetical protein